MIVYEVKMLNGKVMWDAPMQKRRRSDSNARFAKKIRRMRRIWYWHSERWNQRHGINNDND